MSAAIYDDSVEFDLTSLNCWSLWKKKDPSSSFRNVNHKSVEVNEIKHYCSTDAPCAEEQGSCQDVVRTVCILATIYPQKEPPQDEIHMLHTKVVCDIMTGWSAWKKKVDLVSERPFLSCHRQGLLQINQCIPWITVTEVCWFSNAFTHTQSQCTSNPRATWKTRTLRGISRVGQVLGDWENQGHKWKQTHTPIQAPGSERRSRGDESRRVCRGFG